MHSTVIVRISAAVGMLLGVLSMAAGGRVLAGIDRPDYVVLPWLVVYNVAAGAVGVIVALAVWQLRTRATGLARAVAAAHGAVLAVLITLCAAGSPVAADSVVAMLVRTVVWAWIALAAGRSRLARARAAGSTRSVP